MRRPSTALTRLWAQVDPPTKRLARATRRLLLEHTPEAWELIYETYAISVAFSGSDRLGDAFCHLVVYPSGKLNLGFNDGATLPDPGGLLRGTGKRIRHVPLTDAAQLEDPQLSALVDAAVELAATRQAERGRPALPGRAVVKAG